MPSGKVHDYIAFASIIPVFMTGHYLLKLNPTELYLFTGITLFSQFMFGPDLDSLSCQYKRWGVLRWIWIPYRKIFSHRSRFSHGILFGPIFRCIYLILAITFLFTVIRFLFLEIANLDIAPLIGINLTNNLEIHTLIPFLLPVILGIFLGAAIHTFTDKIFSFFKNLV